MLETPDFKIRYVISEDYHSVMTMASKFVKMAYPEEPVDTYRLTLLFNNALENEDFSGLILISPEGIPKGFILCSISELYFHPKSVASCLAIWVEEDSRSQSLDLIRAYEKWAVYRQAKMITLSTYEGLSPKNLGKIYSKLGYSLSEQMYGKDL